MKKIFGLLLLFEILLLCGCSWYSELAIINFSDKPVEVTYCLKERDLRPKPNEACCPKGYIFRQPKIVSIEDLGKKLISGFPDWEYSYDSGTGTVSTVIPPKKALWVDSIPNYSGNVSDFSYSYIQMQKLIINSGGKEIIYEGMDLFKAFERYHLNPFDDSLYAIEINE